MRARVKRMLVINSSMVHKIGFDPQTPGVGRGYLAVQFANLTVYGYSDVSWEEYLALLNSDSIGVAFNELIKTKYKGTKLSGNDSHLIPYDVAQESEAAQTPKAKPATDDPPMFDVLGGESQTEETSASKRRRRK